LNRTGSTLHSRQSFAAVRGAALEASRSKDRKVKSMPLIQILLTLIVVGVLLWLVNRFIPMAGSIKSILNAVVVIGVVLWLLNVFGLFHSISRIRVG
jgi:cation transporter-like permease